MSSLADTVRLVNGLLAVTLVMVLTWRLTVAAPRKYERLYLVGVLWLVLAVLVGSYLRRGAKFTVTIPMNTLGLTVLIIAAIVSWHSNRRH